MDYYTQGRLKVSSYLSKDGKYYYYMVRVGGQTWYVKPPNSDSPLPEYIEYEGLAGDKYIYVTKYKECEAFKPLNFSNMDTEYGADFETAVRYNNRLYTPDMIHELKEVDKKDLEAVIIAGAFHSRNNLYVWDITRNSVSELEDFILSPTNKIFRFFNLNFDGKFILDMLFNKGYKEVGELGKVEGQFNEFVSLKNLQGRIFAIEYRSYETIKDDVSGLVINKIFTTKIVDTANLFPMFSLAQVAKDFQVTNDKGYPITKGDSGDFTWDNTFDKDGLMKQSFIDYMITDALIARRAYNCFMQYLSPEIGKKRNHLTIGSIAFKELCLSSFGTIDLQEGFKHVLGDVPIEIDKYYRKMLYRGGYGILNRGYQEVIKGCQYADIVSMYPSLMKKCNHPIWYNQKLYKKYQKPTKDYKIAVHEIYIRKAMLKEGYLPIIINGRKETKYGVEQDNYIREWDSDIDGKILRICMFEEYGQESEFSIMLRTYDLDFDVVSSRLFKTVHGVFDDFIDKWFDIKSSTKKGTAENGTSKLVLNSSYGKLAENPVKQNNRWVLNEEKDYVVMEHTTEVTEIATRSLFVGANITHRGRVTLWLLAEKIGFNKIVLMATDSITWQGNITDIPLGDKLGDLSEEYRDIDFWGFGEKAYQLLLPDGSVVTKCNGMKKEIAKTLGWQELKEGLTYSQLGKKTVKGGVILIEVEKSLKGSMRHGT